MKKRTTLSLLGAGLLVCGVIALAFRAHEPDPSDRVVDAQETAVSRANTKVEPQVEGNAFAKTTQNREEETAADANPAIPLVPASTEGTPAEVARSASRVGMDSETQESAVPTKTNTTTSVVESSNASGDDDLALARAAFAERDYTTCAQYLERAAQDEKASFDAHYLLGLSLRYLGRYDDSNTAFDAALRIEPGNVRALVNSARTLVRLGRPEEAETRLVAAIESAPEDDEAWNVLGRAQLARGELDDAVTSFTRACELDASNAHARNNLGLTHLQAGAWAEAALALETAIGIRDDVAYFHNNLGLAYEKLGRAADAARAFERALVLRPDHLKAQVSLARVQPFVHLDEGDLASVSSETLQAKASLPTEP